MDHVIKTTEVEAVAQMVYICMYLHMHYAYTIAKPLCSFYG